MCSPFPCSPLLPLSCHSEEKDLRITKVPAGVSSILVEAGPNPANDNSAVWVNYQVGRGGGGGKGRRAHSTCRPLLANFGDIAYVVVDGDSAQCQ
jgi:hypothetical protein